MREENRLETCVDPDIRDLIEESVRRLTETEAELERQISELLCSDAEFRRKAEQLQTQPGVGEKTATVLLAHFPELGTLTRGQTAALAGLAPYANESGQWKGHRRIYGGRAMVRRAMYLAAKSAARWCPVISEFYQRLREAGKTYNQALIACARKLLVRLNTVLKQLPEQSTSTTTDRKTPILTPSEATAT